MPSLSHVAWAVAAGANLVSAHGYLSSITIDGKSYAGYPPSSAPYENPAVDRIAWSDTATDNGYVAPDAFTSGDIICHRGAENAALTATVAAGGTVSLQWNTWPDSHKGPVINYLADCGGDCTTVDKTTLEFFKFAESGLIDDSSIPGTWASDELISNNFTQTITIPSTLKAGSYVLRHEIIALHSAGSADGAQNYPQCINLEVTGSGSELPTGTLGTALYTEDDAGILINIYQTLSTYVIPGPTLAFSDSGSGSSTATAAVSSAAAAKTTSASSTTSLANAAATSTSAAKTSSAAKTTSTSKAPSTSKTALAVASASTAATTTASGTTASPTKPSCNQRRHARDVQKK